MAKAERYVDIDEDKLPAPIKKLQDAADEAIEAFNSALIKSCEKNGVIPKDKHGGVSRNFGKLQVGIFAEPVKARGKTEKVILK